MSTTGDGWGPMDVDNRGSPRRGFVNVQCHVEDRMSPGSVNDPRVGTPQRWTLPVSDVREHTSFVVVVPGKRTLHLFHHSQEVRSSHVSVSDITECGH